MKNKGPLNIDKHIPIPCNKSSRTGVTQQLRRMKVGESFISPWEGISTPHSFARGCGIKVCVRKQPDGSVRVWRVA